MIATTPNSARWAAMQTLLQALQTGLQSSLTGPPELAGLRVVHNPRGPASLAKGPVCVFIKDQTDTLVNNAGQTEQRSHQFLLGVVARSEQPECDADALHELAANLLRASKKQLLQERRAENLSETNTQFEAASLEVDGALCLSTWTLTYRKPSPSNISTP